MILTKNRVGAAVAVFALLITGITQFISPLKASAITRSEAENLTLSWINRATIQVSVGSETFKFYDRDIGDFVYEYEIMNPPAGCMDDGNAGLIWLEPGANGSVTFDEGDIDFDFVDSSASQSGCIDMGGMETKPIANTNNFSYAYGFYETEATIVRVDNNDNWRFEQTGNFPDVYVRTSEDGQDCQDVIVVNSARTAFKLYQLDDSGSTPAPPETHNTAGCNIAPSQDISARAGHTRDNLLQPLSASGSIGGGSGSGSGSEEEDHSCESGAGATGWIICKVLELAGGTLNFLDSMIVGMLDVDETYLTNPATEEIWKRFRNIAYLILVPAFLVMVISTALGFEFVSAYTVKKALPRLVIATIFIALSFEITKFLIIMTNNIGRGMLGLMSNVSGDQVNNLQDLFEPGWFSGAGLLGLMGVGAAGAAAAALVGVFAGAVSALIGFLGAAAIAVLLVLLLLGFRQVLIIALAILSPLAILSWIFPGNDKLWNLWKDSFIKLLMLYPVIMLTLGAGRMFASMVGDVTITDGPDQAAIVESTLNTIIKLCAYVLPYFLIPFLFKTAGGLFANIAGMSNSRQKGLMDRSRNWGRGRRDSAQKDRRDALASRRSTRATQRWIDRGKAGGVVGSLRSSEAGKRLGGLDSEDMSVLKAQVGQHALRGRSAIEQMKKQRFGTATYDLNQETIMENRPRSKDRTGQNYVLPGANATKAQKDDMSTLEYLQWTAVNDTSEDGFRQQAAVAQLVQQQDIGGLDYVRSQARQKSAAGNDSVRVAYNQQVPDNYGALKTMSPDLANEVAVGETDADAFLAAPGHFAAVSTEHQASMKPAAWKKWAATDPTGARAAYDKIVADPQISSKLSGDVHQYFP